MLRKHVVNRHGDDGGEWIAIHCNGIHTYQMEWTTAWIGMQWIPLHTNGYQSTAGRRAGAARPCAHAVCVKTFYRITARTRRRHHIIRAEAAAGVVTEAKPGQTTTTTQTPASAGESGMFSAMANLLQH